MPYSLAGFLWYQGEEDEPYCGSYRELLGMMIGEWRALWSESLPFLIVQLPQWIDKKVDEGDGDPMLWPVLREAQWDAAQSIDNVFAICTMDCGEYNNIHPVDKRTPGERLGNCALRQVYGMSRIPVYGPTVLGFRCDEGGRVRLFFRYAHGISAVLRPTVLVTSSPRACLRWCVCRNVPVSSLPVPMVCSIRPTPRFSWIAILTIWSTQRSTWSITTPRNSVFRSTAAVSARLRWPRRKCQRR